MHHERLTLTTVLREDSGREVESVAVHYPVSGESSQVPSGGDGGDAEKWLDLRSILKVEQQVLLRDWWWGVTERKESG